MYNLVFFLLYNDEKMCEKPTPGEKTLFKTLLNQFEYLQKLFICYN